MRSGLTSRTCAALREHDEPSCSCWDTPAPNERDRIDRLERRPSPVRKASDQSDQSGDVNLVGVQYSPSKTVGCGKPDQEIPNIWVPSQQDGSIAKSLDDGLCVIRQPRHRLSNGMATPRSDPDRLWITAEVSDDARRLGGIESGHENIETVHALGAGLLRRHAHHVSDAASGVEEGQFHILCAPALATQAAIGLDA